MEWIGSLFFGEGIAHAVLILSLVITLGIALGKIRIAGVSLGITWILFVGIAFSHFGMRLDAPTLTFVKEFGLILFVYSIGLQVGPGFFSSFRKGGIRLNLLAVLIILLGIAVTYALHWSTRLPMTTLVGILSGAVTNTPGLGAAQQAYTDMTGGGTDETIALGYAAAYPLGVIGIIGSLILLRYLFRIKLDQEAEAVRHKSEGDTTLATPLSLQVKNPAMFGKQVQEVSALIDKRFVISRVLHTDDRLEIANSCTLLNEGDKVFIIAQAQDTDALTAFIGEEIPMTRDQWIHLDDQLTYRRIIITKPELNGKTFGQLRLRSGYGVNVTRVNRAGVDLIPNSHLQLQMGDRLNVVGTEEAIGKVAKLLGNSVRRLRVPNLIPIFIGIALGVFLGSIPFTFASIPQPVKLGLAGGPLVVSILISRFGPRFKMVTYTTQSANLMLREIGISLFLAAVGLGAGEEFVDTIVYGGGYAWIGYGFIITVVPLLITGIVARLFYKTDYFALMGLIAGSTTDPPALAYSNATAGNDLPSVSYATVYPLTMFLRVLSAQLLVLLAAA